MQAVIDFLITKATEKTTWVGILVIIAGAVGIETSDKLIGDIAEGVTAILGAILVIMREQNKAKV